MRRFKLRQRQVDACEFAHHGDADRGGSGPQISVVAGDRSEGKISRRRIAEDQVVRGDGPLAEEVGAIEELQAGDGAVRIKGRGAEVDIFTGGERLVIAGAGDGHERRPISHIDRRGDHNVRPPRLFQHDAGYSRGWSPNNILNIRTIPRILDGVGRHTPANPRNRKCTQLAWAEMVSVGVTRREAQPNQLPPVGQIGDRL